MSSPVSSPRKTLESPPVSRVNNSEQRWHKSLKTWGIQWCFEACVWQVWAHITDFYTLLISRDPHPRDAGPAAHAAPVGRTQSRRLTDADLPEMHKWLFFVPPASLQGPWRHMARGRGGIVEAEQRRIQENAFTCFTGVAFVVFTSFRHSVTPQVFFLVIFGNKCRRKACSIERPSNCWSYCLWIAKGRLRKYFSK